MLRKKPNPSRAPIAQLVERRTFNPCVAGSSPAGGTILTIKNGDTMKKTALSVIATAIMLSACETKTVVVKETLPATLPPATVPSIANKETNYLNGLTADYPTEVTNLGKPKTIELGYLMCQAIDDGTTLQDLLNMSYKMDVDAGLIGAVVREAVENFCPENQWFIDAALNA